METLIQEYALTMNIKKLFPLIALITTTLTADDYKQVSQCIDHIQLLSNDLGQITALVDATLDAKMKDFFEIVTWIHTMQDSVHKQIQPKCKQLHDIINQLAMIKDRLKQKYPTALPELEKIERYLNEHIS
jgi:hypothetical protein